MTKALLLLLVGIALSAFFSGSETGFYRVTRVRLVIDALKGDWISRWLLRLANNPAYFVATTLVGNNLANYLTSLAVVLITKNLAEHESVAIELTATILFSPLVFVYGELLPKYLFFRAPNRLLRAGGLPFLFFSVVFAPVSAVLWGLGRALQWLLGEAPLRVRLALARQELQEVLDEGHEVGILQPAQRRLAQNLFAIAGQRVAARCRAVQRSATVSRQAGRSELLAAASRLGATLLILRGRNARDLAGYVRVVDLYLPDEERQDYVRPLIRMGRNTSLLEAMLRLQSEKEEVAQIVNNDGSTLGLLYADDLVQSFVRTNQ
jgi:CBS domain containing-hemolysin-like protein